MQKFILSILIIAVMPVFCGNQLVGQDQPDPLATEVVVPAETHMPFALSSFISSKNSQRGDRFYGEVIYPVTINNRIVIPAGSYVRGTITEIKRAGRVKGKAELLMRFDDLMLPNGVTKNFSADLYGIHSPSGNFYRRESEKIQGDSSKGRDAGIIADAGSQGAIIGVLAGQGKGLAIGSGAGALAGIIAVLLTRGKDIELGSDTEFDIVLKRELVFSEKELDFSKAPPYQRRAVQQNPVNSNPRRTFGWPRLPVPFGWP